MREWFERILGPLLFINALSILSFRLTNIISIENSTPSLLLRTISEFLLVGVCLISFIAYARRENRLKPLIYFTLGMLFFNSWQVIGSAVEEGFYYSLLLNLFNMAFVTMFMLALLADIFATQISNKIHDGRITFETKESLKMKTKVKKHPADTQMPEPTSVQPKSRHINFRI